MRRRIVAGLIALSASVAAAHSQTIAPSPAYLLKTARPLVAAEIPPVLAAVRSALAGRTLKLSYVPDGPGPEMLMAADGRPRFLRAVSGYTTSASPIGRTGAGVQQTHVTLAEIT